MRLARAGGRQALRYRNRDIVEKFSADYGVPVDASRAIFDDTKRWLWLHVQPGCPRLVVTSELQIIDEMWHTFVLFTRPYTEYCTTLLGRYIHHNPTTPRDRRRLQRQFERDREGYLGKRRAELEAQYEFIRQHLGSATLVRWYAEYPLRYGRAFFKRHGIETPALDRAVRGRLRAMLRA